MVIRLTAILLVLGSVGSQAASVELEAEALKLHEKSYPGPILNLGEREFLERGERIAGLLEAPASAELSVSSQYRSIRTRYVDILKNRMKDRLFSISERKPPDAGSSRARLLVARAKSISLNITFSWPPGSYGIDPGEANAVIWPKDVRYRGSKSLPQYPGLGAPGIQQWGGAGSPGVQSGGSNAMEAPPRF